MIRKWVRSLSRVGTLLGALLIGVGLVSTLFLVLSATDTVDDVLLVVILGGSLSAVTGAAVYGYVWTTGD